MLFFYNLGKGVGHGAARQPVRGRMFSACRRLMGRGAEERWRLTLSEVMPVEDIPASKRMNEEMGYIVRKLTFTACFITKYTL